jgi:ABC-type branched-subunit amino acid transport system substrate-binding protein
LAGILLTASALGAQQSPVAAAQERESVTDFRGRELEYPGPGREDEPPEGLTEVRIGWFGPSDPSDPSHGGVWTAARMAVDEANQADGYRGLPFRLLPAWSENPWGTGVSLVARLVYEDRVWAILGSVDGPTTHLAEQIVAKARLALVSPVSTDPSVNLAGVPWMFSVVPGDHLWAPVLVRALESAPEPSASSNFVLLSATDHDSRMAVAEVLASLAARDLGPAFHLQLESGTDPSASRFAEQLEVFDESPPAGTVIIAGAEESTALVSALRQRGWNGPIFGSPAMGRRRFSKLAGDDAAVRFPSLYGSNRDPRARREFEARFAEITGVAPDWAETHAYDAARLLIAAIRTAGLNRARIRDALADLSPWRGVSGVIEWDAIGQNKRTVRELKSPGNSGLER